MLLLDPHSRLFNVDVAGTTKTPNVWRAANYKGTDLVRVGCRIGLGRFKVKGTAKLRGPTVESADMYSPSANAEMFLPVHYHKGMWLVDKVLVEFMLTQLSLDITEEVELSSGKKIKVQREPLFVVDLGVVTWLGAEHGALVISYLFVCNSNETGVGVRDIAEAMLSCDKFQRLPHLRLCLGA